MSISPWTFWAELGCHCSHSQFGPAWPPTWNLRSQKLEKRFCCCSNFNEQYLFPLRSRQFAYLQNVLSRRLGMPWYKVQEQLCMNIYHLNKTRKCTRKGFLHPHLEKTYLIASSEQISPHTSFLHSAPFGQSQIPLPSVLDVIRVVSNSVCPFNKSFTCLNMVVTCRLPPTSEGMVLLLFHKTPTTAYTRSYCKYVSRWNKRYQSTQFKVQFKNRFETTSVYELSDEAWMTLLQRKCHMSIPFAKDSTYLFDLDVVALPFPHHHLDGCVNLSRFTLGS